MSESRNECHLTPLNCFNALFLYNITQQFLKYPTQKSLPDTFSLISPCGTNYLAAEFGRYSRKERSEFITRIWVLIRNMWLIKLKCRQKILHSIIIVISELISTFRSACWILFSMCHILLMHFVFHVSYFAESKTFDVVILLSHSRMC